MSLLRKNKIKKYCTASALFYIALYLPLTITVYSTPWYSWNTNESTRVYLGTQTIKTAHKNLTRYFLHQEQLHADFWSKKEILHMKDVRKIYDTLFLIAIICIMYLTICTNPFQKTDKKWVQTLQRIHKKNIYIPLIFLLVIPFFANFWSNVFHAVLFSNDLWVMTPKDLSYHLFPLDFFIKSLLGIVVLAMTLHYIMYYYTKKTLKNL